MSFQVLVIVLTCLLLAEKVWAHWMVILFFRRPLPPPTPEVHTVSILQPIVSGDRTLANCLEQNLDLRSRHEVEYLWLLDENDTEAARICESLAAAHPRANVRIVRVPLPDDRSSPKMVKLIEGVRRAHGEILCVLDDDTLVPDDGLEVCLSHLRDPDVGAAFGLPYYTHFEGFWSSLVAYYGNSQNLSTYIPYTMLIEPVTMCGMFYCFHRATYDAIGGFGGLESALVDDFAVARLFRAKGYRLVQTTVRNATRIHVEGCRAFLRTMHRWMIFARQTVMKELPLPELAIVYSVGVGSVLGPLLLVAALAIQPSTWLAGIVALYLAYHYLIFAHFNAAYLHHASPLSRSWLVVLMHVVLPLQLVVASLAPRRLYWRGQLIEVERGGGFRVLKRRAT